MSIASKLTSLATKMSARLESINAALVAKNQAAVDSLNDVPSKIEAIQTGVDPSIIQTQASEVLSSATYMDSNGTMQPGTIPTKSDANVSVTTNKVSFPAGYYAETHSGSVGTINKVNPTVTVDSNGLITAKATQPAGYVTQGEIKGTKQLTCESWTVTYTDGSTATKKVVIL